MNTVNGYQPPVRVKLIGGPGDGKYMEIASLPNGDIPQTVAYFCRVDVPGGFLELKGDETTQQIGHTYYHRFELRFNDNKYCVFYHTDMNEAEILPTLINGYTGKNNWH